MLLKSNEGSNHNNLISYAAFNMNSNYSYAPSISSVIVKNESSYKNPPILSQEMYASDHTPTILTAPAINIDCTVDPKQVNSLNYPRSSTSNYTSQLKTYDCSQETHHPEPLLNTHGQFTMYPQYYRQPPNQLNTVSYSTNMTQRDLDKPPPAHINAMVTSSLPKFTPVSLSTDDLQVEPLDLVVMSDAQSPDTNKLKTNVSLRFYSVNNVTKPDPQEITNSRNINISDNSDQLDNLETSLLNNTVNSSLTTETKDSTNVSKTLSWNHLKFIPPMDLATIPFTNSMTITPVNHSTIPITSLSTISRANATTVSAFIPSTISVVNSKTVLSTNSSTISKENINDVSTIVSKSIALSTSTDISKNTSAIIPSSILITTSSTIVSTGISTTTSSTNSMTNLTNYDSSSSTPPPILMPAITEITSVTKTYHHKLKKAWLQRHTWAEDLKEAGVNIDQHSPSSFSQIDDTPPVLQCEITNKRKKSKTVRENEFHEEGPSRLSPWNSDLEPQTLVNETENCKKRKVSNSTIPSENLSATESENNLDGIPDNSQQVKVPKKRGRKPKVVVSIPLKKGENNGDEIRFFQSGPCLNAGSKLYKCRECRIFMNKKKKHNTTQEEIDNIFCRFYAFRRLFTNKNGQIMNAGFPDPFKDVSVVS